MNRLLIALIVSAGTLGGGTKAAELTSTSAGTAMAGLNLSHQLCGTSHADVTTAKKWLYTLAAARGMNQAVVDEAAAASQLASFESLMAKSPNLAAYEAQKSGACAAVDTFVGQARAATDTTPLGHGTSTYTLKYGAYPIETGLYWAKCRELRDNWNAKANNAHARTCVKEEVAAR